MTFVYRSQHAVASHVVLHNSHARARFAHFEPHNMYIGLAAPTRAARCRNVLSTMAAVPRPELGTERSARQRTRLTRLLWASLAVACGFLLCVCAPREARATQPLGMFLERAKVHSFDNRESRALREQKGAEAQAALGGLLPVFTARGQYIRNQYEAVVQFPGVAQRILIQPQNQWDGALQVDAPLLDLSAYHRYRAARALGEAGNAQGDVTRTEVAKAVAASYFQFIGASALALSAKESVNSARGNLRLVSTRKGAGAATDFDLERARVNLERAQRDSADAELGRVLSARRLETLSGLAPSPAQEFPADDLHVEEPLPRFAQRSGSTPADRAARGLAEAADEHNKAASAALLPSISATAQERFTNATSFSGKSASYALQVSALWRFDYGTLATSAALAASARVQQVRLQRTQRAVSDAIFEAHQRVDAGIAKSHAARAEVGAARRAAKIAGERFVAGAATQLDVTQAQREVFLADSGRIQADADLAYARVALRLEAGLSAADEAGP